jgi:lipopolysaccharide/colanic/teichoic acid biosynthesis glycosyltransferase
MLINIEPREVAQAVAAEPSASRARPRPAPRSEPTILRVPVQGRGQRVYLALRRALDVTTALILSIATAPILILAALAVKLTSRGPALYTQVRTGRDGRTFIIYKLRTMIDNCESLTGPRWTIPGDPRVTPVGWLLRHTHIDELPQLFNVLCGNMSLIGPRPERPEFVAELERHIPGYQRRHAVLPGITGLAQVQLPPDTDVDSVRRKLLYDLYYVRHQGPLLDLRVMVTTALHMFGLPCSLLQKMGLVPGPEAVEGSTEFAAPATPRLRKQAA